MKTTAHQKATSLRKVLLTSLLVLSGFASVELNAATRWETLEAIHMVENPQNSRQPGSFGELGAYQFRSSTWQMYTSRPFQDALDRAASDEIAVKHYEWLRTALQKAGFEASVYNIAMAWNAGIGSVIRGTVPRVTHDYATRVHNIAWDLNARFARERAASLAANN